MIKKISIGDVEGVTCKDAAKLLGCSTPHLSFLIKTGRVQAKTLFGRSMLVDVDSIFKYNADPKRRNRKGGGDET